jgi:oxygen-independent coproporphyrinogen-3 oxidase
MTYWKGGNYIGLGLAAHSHRDGRRYWNTPDLADYLRIAAQDPHKLKAGEEVLSARQRLTETFLIGLRLTEGVDLWALERRLGVVLDPKKKERIEEFVRDGLLAQEGAAVKATDKGRPLLDEISGCLV